MGRLRETQSNHTRFPDASLQHLDINEQKSRQAWEPQGKAPTHLQHCFFMLRPPNLGLSRQLVHTPQSSGTWQPGHCPQRLDRRPFFTGGSCGALFLVTGLIGLMGGARGSASSEPATDDLSVKETVISSEGGSNFFLQVQAKILKIHSYYYRHSNLTLIGTPKMKYIIIKVFKAKLGACF